MGSSKRARSYARRRQEKWEQRRALAQARRRRRRLVALVAACVVLAVVLVTVWANRDDGAADAIGPEPPAPTEVPDPALAEGRAWQVTMETSRGSIELELDGAAAPQAVANFLALSEAGFFDGTRCHRLVTTGIFVLQCGDPTGTGTGGPAYRFGPVENAPADDLYPAGTLAMARVSQDAHSMGSQFFLVYEDSVIPSDSAGGYTVFGHVTSGLDVVREVAQGGVVEGGVAPVHDVTIERIEAG